MVAKSDASSASASAAPLPKRRHNFTLGMKQQAIEWIMSDGRGLPRRAVKHFRGLNWDVSADTIQKWWKNRAKIMSTTDVEPKWSLLSAGQEQLLASVIRRRARKVRVSSKWIVLAVRQMFPDKAHRKFSASKTWLVGFTQRHGLKLVGVTVVTSASDILTRRSTSAESIKNRYNTHHGRIVVSEDGGDDEDCHTIVDDDSAGGGWEEKTTTVTVAA